MKLESEKIEVVAVIHREGEGKNGAYKINELVYNLENGIQEHILIPEEIATKLKKGQKGKLEMEKGYNGKLYVREFINI